MRIARGAIAAAGATCVLVGACSASSSSPAPSDAGEAGSAPVDAAPVDAGNPFATPDAGTTPPVDAGSPCDQLRAQVTQLQVAARACNPQGASECNGAVDGICCPISVSFNTGQPVDDFTQAVKSYKSQCNPDCTGIMCQPAPTNTCIGGGTGTKGTCE